MTKARDLADLLDASGNLKEKQGRTVGGRDLKNDGDKLDGVEAGATADQTHSEIRSLIVAGSDTNVFTDADHTKLDGIEANATADQTKADIDALNVDADTLDGQHGSYYTNYTDTEVANLVSSAPGTLDTLNELAAALGDDPNFATTTATNIGTKANKTITVSAGSGLTGGGDLTANRTLTVGGGTGITVNANDIAIDSSYTGFDGRYYTETEADSRFVNTAGDTMTGNLILDGSTARIYDTDSYPLVQVNASKAYFGSTSRATTTLASSSTITHTRGSNTYQIFTDNYHPYADKWTTSRTLSLSGDASGSVSWDGSSNATLSVTVANDSHTHSNYLRSDASDTFTTLTGTTLTTTNLTIGSSAKINFQNNDSISYNDGDGIGAFSFNADAGTANAKVKAGSFHGDGSSLTGIASGANDDIFWENGQNVTTNYTITNGKNAMSAGPITINSGVTVTVGDGETWTVV